VNCAIQKVPADGEFGIEFTSVLAPANGLSVVGLQFLSPTVEAGEVIPVIGS
jgi:hypothetical protein